MSPAASARRRLILLALAIFVLGLGVIALVIRGKTSFVSAIIVLTLRDRYETLVRGQGSFNDESRKVAIPCDAIPHTKQTAVLFVFGQSNSTNEGDVRYTPGAHVYNFNIFTGRCFVAADPLLGTSGTGGGFVSRLGDQLIKAGHFSDVVLTPLSVGGTSIEDWAPGGKHHHRILAAIRRLELAGFQPTFLLWHQGEGNVGPRSNNDAYKLNFMNMLRVIRAHGVRAPIFVPLVSVCGGFPDLNSRRAQAELADPTRGIYPGPDTDTLGINERHDGCHISGGALDKHAEMWFLTLKRYLTAGPDDPGIRVTAVMLGAGTASPSRAR